MDQFLQEKSPVFVTVYDRLYEMLTDGTYPVGGALPPETRLASLLAVSRETLRKSLKLLEEDGLLQKVKGKGNFVLDLHKPMVSSLEKLGHPIHKCLQVPLAKEVEIQIHLEVPSEYMEKLFKRETETAVAVDRWYRSGGKVVAYTLTLAPIETFLELGLEYADKANLLNFLEKGIYQIATRSHIKVQATSVGDFISDRYVLNEAGELNLLTENLYRGDDFSLLIHNKHYIHPEVCSIEINAE